MEKDESGDGILGEMESDGSFISEKSEARRPYSASLPSDRPSPLSDGKPDDPDEFVDPATSLLD